MLRWIRGSMEGSVSKQGGCGEGFEGICKERPWTDEKSGFLITLLLCVLTTDRVSQRFCREVVVWKTLRHPNVLPLLGVTMTEDRLIMVSEWMVKGNIRQFMKAENNADRLGLVCSLFKVLIFACH